MKGRVFLSLAVLIGMAAGCRSTAEPLPVLEEAVVLFTFGAHPADTMRVLVRNATTLREARRVIAGRSSATIPIGPIVRGAGVDPRYPFHFIPDSLTLAEMTIELCDGAPMRTPAEVDAFFLGTTGDPNAERAYWCPWSARPIAIE